MIKFDAKNNNKKVKAKVSKMLLMKIYLLQDQLEDLELSGFVKVNYTGSWLKTVNWLHWLTLLAARSHKGGKWYFYLICTSCFYLHVILVSTFIKF